ncbi:MAG: hypothetical protein WDM84_07975 [Bauldia sp.]
MRDRVLFELLDELGGAGPGVRPIVQQLVERMIDGPRLLTGGRFLVEVQRQRAQRLAAHPHAGDNRDAAQRYFRRDRDIRRGRLADAEQRREGGVGFSFGESAKEALKHDARTVRSAIPPHNPLHLSKLATFAKLANLCAISGAFRRRL